MEVKTMFAAKLKEHDEKLRQEGMQQGMQQGRQEERIEAARRMKTDGVSVELIARYTGLGVDEIERL